MTNVEKARRLDGGLRQLRVSSDGARVTYLRRVDPSTGWALWAHDVASGTGRPIGPAGGVDRYEVDDAARVAAFTGDGRLYRADLGTGEVTTLPAAGPVTDARPDPTGTRIGYLTDGHLRVIDEAGTDALLAGEPAPADGGQPHVRWGLPEPTAATWFGRRRGWWWGPDGRTVLAARVDLGRPRPEVSLHLLELDGGWVDVHWDRETYPYLVSVCWREHRDPLIAVLRRPQQHGLVLAVDARTGETQVHAELADPRWVEPVTGTPCHLPDGRVLVGGELAHDGYDARCLFADGTLLTPPWLYVRRVVGPLADGPDLLVEGSAGEPSEQHLFRIDTGVGAVGADARRVTGDPGWHRGVVGGGTLVIGSESLDRVGLRWSVWRDGELVGRLAAATPDPAARVPAAGTATAAAAVTTGQATATGAVPTATRPATESTAERPRPVLERVTDRRLPTGVLYPRGHVSGRRLPVLLETAGLTQGVRAVRTDWAPRQEWADAGFAVVVVDHRGTPGAAPSFEKVVHRRLADLALADLADALATLSGKHPDLDLDRVAVRGHGVGGWLAALAVLRRPELFRCAVAESPVVDWAADDPPLAERYLGLLDDAPDVFWHHSLVAAAAVPPGTDPVRPLLLVPPAPTADDETGGDRAGGSVHELTAALAETGRPCFVLPPAGDPTVPAGVRDFLRQLLG